MEQLVDKVTGHQSLCETTPLELSNDQCYRGTDASPEGISQL